MLHTQPTLTFAATLVAGAALSACAGTGGTTSAASLPATSSSPHASSSSTSSTTSSSTSADTEATTCETVSAAVAPLGVVPEDAALDQAATTITDAAQTATPALRGQVFAVASALQAQRDAADGSEQIDARRAVLTGLDALDDLCLAAGSNALH